MPTLNKKPKAYLNLNLPLCFEEAKFTQDEIYEYLLLPSFKNAINKNYKLIFDFCHIKPTSDFLELTFMRLANTFGIKICQDHLKFIADFPHPERIIEDEVYDKCEVK